MRLVRFRTDEGPRCGRVDGDRIVEHAPGAMKESGRVFALADAHLLTPCEPSKLIVVAVNYAKHGAETGSAAPTEPVIHPIPASPAIAHGQPIVLPPGIGRVDYEAELVVVIGKTCKRVRESGVWDVIAGYTCGNDVSARDVQWAEKPAFARAKSVDTFAPLGPWIETDLDPHDLRVEMRVSGEVRQSSSTREMIFPVETLVAEASRWMTLEAGDCIFTGTPEGIGPLKAGDVCEVTVEGVGTLRNPVAQEGSE